MALLKLPQMGYSSPLIRHFTHLTVALRKRILERKLSQTKLPFSNEITGHEVIQITINSFVSELFNAAFNHLRILVDNRNQSEINVTIKLMQELIHIIETDLEKTPEYDVNLRSLMTEFGHLVKYFR